MAIPVVDLTFETDSDDDDKLLNGGDDQATHGYDDNDDDNGQSQRQLTKNEKLATTNNNHPIQTQHTGNLESSFHSVSASTTNEVSTATTSIDNVADGIVAVENGVESLEQEQHQQTQQQELPLLVPVVVPFEVEHGDGDENVYTEYDMHDPSVPPSPRCDDGPTASSATGTTATIAASSTIAAERPNTPTTEGDSLVPPPILATTAATISTSASTTIATSANVSTETFTTTPMETEVVEQESSPSKSTLDPLTSITLGFQHPGQLSSDPTKNAMTLPAYEPSDKPLEIISLLDDDDDDNYNGNSNDHIHDPTKAMGIAESSRKNNIDIVKLEFATLFQDRGKSTLSTTFDSNHHPSVDLDKESTTNVAPLNGIPDIETLPAANVFETATEGNTSKIGLEMTNPPNSTFASIPTSPAVATAAAAATVVGNRNNNTTTTTNNNHNNIFGDPNNNSGSDDDDDSYTLNRKKKRKKRMSMPSPFDEFIPTDAFASLGYDVITTNNNPTIHTLSSETSTDAMDAYCTTAGTTSSSQQDVLDKRKSYFYCPSRYPQQQQLQQQNDDDDRKPAAKETAITTSTDKHTVGVEKELQDVSTINETDRLRSLQQQEPMIGGKEPSSIDKLPPTDAHPGSHANVDLGNRKRPLEEVNNVEFLSTALNHPFVADAQSQIVYTSPSAIDNEECESSNMVVATNDAHTPNASRNGKRRRIISKRTRDSVQAAKALSSTNKNGTDATTGSASETTNDTNLHSTEQKEKQRPSKNSASSTAKGITDDYKLWMRNQHLRSPVSAASLLREFRTLIGESSVVDKNIDTDGTNGETMTVDDYNLSSLFTDKESDLAVNQTKVSTSKSGQNVLRADTSTMKRKHVEPSRNPSSVEGRNKFRSSNRPGTEQISRQAERIGVAVDKNARRNPSVGSQRDERQEPAKASRQKGERSNHVFFSQALVVEVSKSASRRNSLGEINQSGSNHNNKSSNGSSLKRRHSDAISEDPVFRSDPILTNLEMQVLFLGVESVYSLSHDHIVPTETSEKKPEFNFDFIWHYATKPLKAELEKLNPRQTEEQKLNQLVRLEQDWLVKMRFNYLREEMRLAYQRGFRRDRMKYVIAELRLMKRKRQRSSNGSLLPIEFPPLRR